MIKKSSIYLFFCLFFLAAAGCVYKDLAPRVVAVNLFDHAVDMVVSDSLGHELLVEDIKPNGSSTALDLEKPGYYSLGWKTEGSAVWQGNTADRMFPALAGGPHLLEKNTLNCILADKTGVIRIFPLSYPAGYGAKICLINASDFTMDELSFLDGSGTSAALIEVGSTPPASITRFVNVLPGEFTCKAVFQDSMGSEAGMAMTGPVVFEDNSCHMLIVFQEKGRMALRHFITGTGPRVTTRGKSE
ncbi:MAG: hypothetical protein EHM28_08805 [Spirochaetaceae bacterium]|nr:MAG: hypothetical protein EHM28_08805 [Spirochaetaceae bacterium]